LLNHYTDKNPIKPAPTKQLPEPNQDARNRSASLIKVVADACANNAGWIPFPEYMNIALYQPTLGYYSGGLQKFGAKGDFITAPEVSPLFAQCLANQFAEIMLNMKQQAADDDLVEIAVIEFGAGSGMLAADLLKQLAKLGCLPENYFIIELSAELKHRQKQTLQKKVPDQVQRVRWLDMLPENIDYAIVLANEVLDAMPVECFSIGNNGVERLMVGFQQGELVSRYQKVNGSEGGREGEKVTAVVSQIQQRSDIVFSEPYNSEFNPAIAGWIASLESSVNNMVMLLIDYGYNEQEYYHADRYNGTLMCYYQHRAHDDYLRWPGLQDITAFVNFTDVAYSAVASGMGVSGYTTQAAFLLANGLSALHAEQVSDDMQQQISLSQQIKTLTLPSEMGDKFKVMALTKNYDIPLTGFSMLDLRNRL